MDCSLYATNLATTHLLAACCILEIWFSDGKNSFGNDSVGCVPNAYWTNSLLFIKCNEMTGKEWSNG